MSAVPPLRPRCLGDFLFFLRRGTSKSFLMRISYCPLLLCLREPGHSRRCDHSTLPFITMTHPWQIVIALILLLPFPSLVPWSPLKTPSPLSPAHNVGPTARPQDTNIRSHHRALSAFPFFLFFTSRGDVKLAIDLPPFCFYPRPLAVSPALGGMAL